MYNYDQIIFLVISEDSLSIGWKNLQLSLLLSHVWSAIITDM